MKKEFEFSALMEFSDDILNEELTESKCDYCNLALNDCSLCGVLSFDCAENGEPIC